MWEKWSLVRWDIPKGDVDPLGGVVNTASRIESTTKEFSANLLISDAVYEQVKDTIKSGRSFEASSR